MNFYLIADIGGTNARYALVNCETLEFAFEKKYLCNDYAEFHESLDHYIKDLSTQDNIDFKTSVKKACIAIAAPVEEDFVQMSNYDWGFSISKMKSYFEFEELRVVNDFLAVAASVPYFLEQIEKGQSLDSFGLLKIGGTESKSGSAISVMGPGTGLGMSYLVDIEGDYRAFATEASDASIAVHTQRQFDIVKKIQELDPDIFHVNIESLVSGLGLERMYEALKAIDGVDNDIKEAPDIVEAALNETCPLAVEALDHFCALLGSSAGNHALTLNATGGVFIAGGIIPRFADYFLKSSFHESFKSKGRKDRPYYYKFMESIPIYLMTHPNPGFLGLRELVKKL